MNFVGDRDVIDGWIASLRPGTPVSYACLTVVPVFSPEAAEPDWLLLDEALGLGVAQVGEVSQAGAVPTLRVANQGMQDLLLLDGEELVGARQNRVLNTTLLVRAARTVDIPVSCAERGRWAYRGRHFSSGHRSLYASVRRAKASQVHASLRMRGTHTSDQAGIWNDLREKARALGIRSPSEAMADAFVARQGDIAGYQQVLAAQPGQVGALVYGGPEWWGLDVLAGPRLFARAWPRILSGYAMDALWRNVSGEPAETGLEHVHALRGTHAEVFPGVGAGDDYRFSGRGVVGAALMVDGVIAHLMAFPA